VTHAQAVALGVLLLGTALGPLLDRLAQWSLRESPDAVWTRRPIVTGAIAGVFGAVAVLLVPTMTLDPAWVALALVAAPIIRTDLMRHRIPDLLNVAALLSGALLLLIPGSLADYGRAWLAALAVTAAMLGLALIGPSGLGMGDVKLAPALGLYLGYLGWDATFIGLAAGFVLAAVAAIGLIARDAIARRPVAGALRRALPFGPFLLVGTLVGLAI
jgi:leader peptidase (prepilin peptidase)/N-methyltransferase